MPASLVDESSGNRPARTAGTNGPPARVASRRHMPGNRRCLGAINHRALGCDPLERLRDLAASRPRLEPGTCGLAGEGRNRVEARVVASLPYLDRLSRCVRMLKSVPSRAAQIAVDVRRVCRWRSRCSRTASWRLGWPPCSRRGQRRTGGNRQEVGDSLPSPRANRQHRCVSRSVRTLQRRRPGPTADRLAFGSALRRRRLDPGPPALRGTSPCRRARSPARCPRRQATRPHRRRK